MRNIILLPFLIVSGLPFAQSFEDLRAPSMPAATIIGTQVNEINRPKTMKSLEATLLNNFLDSNNKFIIPNSYALEFNPYMIGKMRNFDYLDYVNKSFTPCKTFTVSLASTTNFKINDSINSNALGFGARSIIYNGKADERIANKYKAYYDFVQGTMDLNTQLNYYVQQYLDNLGNMTFSVDSLKNYLTSKKEFKTVQNKEMINAIFNEPPVPLTESNVLNYADSIYKNKTPIEEFKNLIDSVQSERYGFRIELDGALSLNFPTNTFGYSMVPKYGFWTNISYTPSEKDKHGLKTARNFSFIFLGRWMNYNDDFYSQYQPTDTSRLETGSVVDLGLRGILEYKKFSVELEFIGRLNQNKEYVTIGGNEYSRTVSSDTYKFVLNLNYNIMDNIVLSYNIGKNYESINNQGGNLISGFTVNFGFGGQKKEDLK